MDHQLLIRESIKALLERLAHDVAELGGMWAPIKSGYLVLAAQPLVRVPADVDVLFRGVSIPSVQRTFWERGYVQVARGDHALTFSHPDFPRYLVDLHHRTDPYGLFNIKSEALFARASRLANGLYVLDPVDAAAVALASLARSRTLDPARINELRRQVNALDQQAFEGRLADYELMMAARVVGLCAPNLRSRLIRRWLLTVPRTKLDALLEPFLNDRVTSMASTTLVRLAERLRDQFS